MRYLMLVLIVLVSGCLGNVSNTTEMNEVVENISNDTETSFDKFIEWQFDGEEWKPSSTPPQCSSLEFTTPVDIDLVTAILWPGQFRGDDYKPHGGFRFDNSESSDITVVAPMDGYLVDASGYISSQSSREVQWMIDIVNPCGVRHRFDHLLELSPKLKEAVSHIEPKVDDSRTTQTERVFIEEGEIIASAVGFSDNVFVDWGVYDFRQRNSISMNPSYEGKDDSKSQSYYAICWFDNIEEGGYLRTLDTGKEGKVSDYCA